MLVGEFGKETGPLSNHETYSTLLATLGSEDKQLPQSKEQQVTAMDAIDSEAATTPLELQSEQNIEQNATACLKISQVFSSKPLTQR